MLDILSGLLLPSRCVGCPDPQGPLCARCRAALDRCHRHRPDPEPPGLPPLAVAAAYAGPARAAVLAYKERSRRDLTRVLGAALAAAVAEVLADRLRPAAVVRLVPVPSAASAARRRGGQHVDRLAAMAARVLRRSGVKVGVAAVLRVRSGPSDSAELTAAERSRAAVGKFEADLARLRGCGSEPGLWIVVDDIVTTGSTLAAACRALSRHKVVVAGAAAVAATHRWHGVFESRYGRSSWSTVKPIESPLIRVEPSASSRRW